MFFFLIERFVVISRYRKGIRAKRILSKGNKFFVNQPENDAAEILHELSFSCSKRGYPDLTVYNKDGSIYGFIEIKPDDRPEMKKEQQVFEDFCIKHNIPFILWRPCEGREKIEIFINRMKEL